MPRLPIYLDNNATTQVDPRVLEAMLPYFTEVFGNAASIGHSFGINARRAVEQSRAKIAKCLNATGPIEIVFTSGATESDNLAIKGVAEMLAHKGNHIVTSKTEHKAVLDSCKHLEKTGFEVTYLDVNEDGLIDIDLLENTLTDKTILVTIMAGNNEIGVLQDLSGIGALCRSRGILFHSDATQAIGKVPFDVRALNVDLASFTAHKIYGPKGAGGLYVRHGAGIKLIAQMDGGGHENGHRSGTLNVPGIVGLAKCLEICLEDQELELAKLTSLRLRLLNGLKANIAGVHVNGHENLRLPGHLSISIEGVNGEVLMMQMPEIAVSSVSACSSGSGATSHVISALGHDEDRALSTLRFGIGRFNTQDEIDYVISRITDLVLKMRNQPASSTTSSKK